MMKKLILTCLIVVIAIPFQAYAQKPETKEMKKITINGTVVGFNKKPVSGAQIFIDSTSTGALTDAMGRFKIKVRPGVKKIIAFSPEFGYCEADISGQDIINLSLDPRVTEMPAFITGNFSGKKLSGKYSGEKKINTYTDIYQMIRQEVPGVVVSGKSIMVQGPNSFFGSSTPLFIVNGVRVNSIDNINPLEVKSIQLLKGSNAAIYGTEGANGVISITLLNRSDR